MSWRPALLVAISIAVVIAVAMVDPVPQDPSYFLFADQRNLLGIPHFMDVMSNMPFLVLGIMGWRFVYAHPETITPATTLAWKVFFFGIALTAFGSGFFHWRPDNQSLIWDRLPMTIGFMSLVSIIIAEYFSPEYGKRSLLPLLTVGAASVAYWAWTESQSAGDLRPYAVVQFLPMLLIPLVIILYKTRSDLSRYLWIMIGFYVAAKISEQLDMQLYGAGGIISGHSLKHLLASLAPATLVFALMRRRAGSPTA
jgi:hypothetical protein